jgi:F-type H+-transporting ATPase subunit gamma
MATLKEVQTKITGVRKTRQITKAMNMVATSKLRSAQQSMEGFRPYAGKFTEVLGSLAESSGDEASPLLIPRDEVKKIHVVLCSSDRGLCGGFNSNLITAARNLIKEKAGENIEFSFTNFGKKGRDWCRKNKLSIISEYIGIVGAKFGFGAASKAGRKLVDGFIDGEFDEVYLIYSEYVNVARQTATIKQILPIPPIEKAESDEQQEDAVYQPEHICEPSPDELLSDLLPRNVYVQIYSGLLETSTSNHAAQMTAMDNATTACNDLIEELTLTYNKARQAAITADLMDIVGGAEALKG